MHSSLRDPRNVMSCLLVLVTLSSGHFLLGGAYAQSPPPAASENPRFNCSPAPCVLPSTQASEGGGTVTDTPIVANPLNVKDLLLGCQRPAKLGITLLTAGS
jgi:hypothetical protein